MKKILFLLACLFAVVTINVNGQRLLEAEATLMTADTLNGAETVNFGATSKITYQSVTLTALCTEIGGTADGTLWVEGSIDGTNYVKLTYAVGKVQYFASDTTEVARQGSESGIVDALVVGCQITDAGFLYYRWSGTGTSGDSTLVTPYYTIKANK